MASPSQRPLLTIAEGVNFFQILLVTVAVVCLAFTYAVMARNKATRAQLEPVIENLKQLRDNKRNNENATSG